MRTGLALLAVVSLVLLGFAPAPFPRKQRQQVEPADITGTWEFVRYESGGQRHESIERLLQASLTQEKFVMVMRQGGQEAMSFIMRHDPYASPPSFTWSRNGGVDFVGSYRLQGDELTMILARGGDLAKRPTDFDGSPALRFVMKRIKRN